MKVLQVVLAAAALAAGSIGCISSAAPPEVARADGAIAHAVEVGAEHDRAALPYLTHARENLARARRWHDLGDEENARRWSLRALADAEVALVVAQETKARDAAQRSLDHASQLVETSMTEGGGR